MDATLDITATQLRPEVLQAVTCEDGSLHLMSQEQIESWNILTLQQAARIIRWDETTGQFLFAPRPAHIPNRMSLQDALVAAKQALQRCESATATIYSNDDAANTLGGCPTSQGFLLNDFRPEGQSLPSPPPSYTSLSRNKCSPLYTSPENESISSEAKFNTWAFLLVLVLALLTIWICGRYLTQEPATHEHLGRLVMEVVCKDMSIRGCIKYVKDGRIGQVM